MEEKQARLAENAVTPTTYAAASIPDINGFQIVEHCVPTLMAWDFLCTFRAGTEFDADCSR
jgi:hypothetical protein